MLHEFLELSLFLSGVLITELAEVFYLLEGGIIHTAIRTCEGRIDPIVVVVTRRLFEGLLHLLLGASGFSGTKNVEQGLPGVEHSFGFEVFELESLGGAAGTQRKHGEFVGFRKEML